MPRPDPLHRPRRLSVTEIELLVRDAYAIYAKHVLGLRPLDPPGRAPDMRERGIVFHEILQRFTAATHDGLPGPEAARARLLDIADALLAERVPAPELRRIWRARLLRTVDWFLEIEADRRGGAHPVATEVKGAMTLDAPGGPFTLTARADRIDRRADGRAEIVDYKSGKPPTRKQMDAGFALQLQLEAAILAAGGFDALEPAEAAVGLYLGLTGSGEGGTDVRHDALAEAAAAERARLMALVAAYDRADTPYAARGRPEWAGQEGDYDHLARRDEWEGEEEA